MGRMQLKWFIAKVMKFILNPPAIRDCEIDKLAKVGARCELTRVTIGKHSYVGHNSIFNSTEIGNYCSIGQYCVVGGSQHPMSYVSTSPVFVRSLNGPKVKYAVHPNIPTPKTIIEHDVWLGNGVYIKAGCTIHTGAVIGMNSVVTHDVGEYEIWGGNPARKIKDRFSEDLKKELLNSRWWEFEEKKIRQFAEYMDKPELFIEKLGHQMDLE